MNTDVKNHAKNDFENFLKKLIKKAFFGKTMENVRRRRYQACTDKTRMNYLISKPNLQQHYPQRQKKLYIYIYIHK